MSISMVWYITEENILLLPKLIYFTAIITLQIKILRTISLYDNMKHCHRFNYLTVYKKVTLKYCSDINETIIKKSGMM